MRMRSRLWLAAFLFFAFSSTWADSHARIVRLSYVEGDVEMDRHDDKGFQRAFVNMPIIEGARLWMRDDARAEVEMEDGSTLRLTPDTIVEFREMRLLGDGVRSSLIDVQQGTVYVDNKSDHDELRLTFANSQQIRPLKASHFRFELDQHHMNLSMFRGDVEVIKENGERVEVRKDETLNIDFSDRDRYYLARGISEGSFDTWDQDRNEERAQAAQKQYVSGYNSAYQYGWDDLYRFGSWEFIPGYGYVWRPFGVASGWDPFWYGRWSYYPVYGWTWISPYNWGWLPYRYGSWVYYNGRGWCWSPGRVHNNWVAVTTVVNPPPNYIRPVRPTRPSGGGPAVVTVNNGPGWDVNHGQRPVDEVPILRPGRGTRDTGGVSSGVVSGTGAPASGPTNQVPGANNIDMNAEGRARPHRDTNVIDNDVLRQRVGTSTPAASGEVSVDRNGRATRDSGTVTSAPASTDAASGVTTDRPSRSIRTPQSDDIVDAMPSRPGPSGSVSARPSRDLELTGTADANRGSRGMTPPAPSTTAPSRPDRPSRDYGTQPAPSQPTVSPRVDRPSRESITPHPAPQPTAPRMDRPSRESVSPPPAAQPSAPRAERPSRDSGSPRTDVPHGSSYVSSDHGSRSYSAPRSSYSVSRSSGSSSGSHGGGSSRSSSNGSHSRSR